MFNYQKFALDPCLLLSFLGTLRFMRVCVEVCAAYGNCKLFICASECAPNALQVPDTYFLACALFIRPRDVGVGAKGQPLSCGQKFDLPVLEFCIIQVSSNLVSLSSIYLLMLDIVATTTATTIT